MRSNLHEHFPLGRTPGLEVPRNCPLTEKQCGAAKALPSDPTVQPGALRQVTQKVPTRPI
jgi:hypothetical protein